MADHDDADDSQFPDNDDLIPYVTAFTLPQFAGRKVTCWGKVTTVNPNGDSFVLKTVDDQDVTVRLSNPLSEMLEGWIEVNGVAQNKQIMCEDFVAFPQEYAADVDANGHKALVKLLGALDDPWNLGGQNANGHDGVKPME